MSDDLVTRLAATDDDEERAKLASELLPDYSEEFYTLLGRHATLDIPQRILDGWDDDEILDSLAKFRFPEPHYPDGPQGMLMWRPSTGPGPRLRAMRAFELLLATLRDQRPLRRDGHRDPEAARMAGLSKGRAAQQVEKERKRQLVRDYAAQGLSQNQTVLKTGISRRSVQRYWPH